MTYTPDQIAQHIAQHVASVGEDSADVRILRQLVAERDAFRAVLDGAGYGNLDTIAQQDPELCKLLGMEVAARTIAALSTQEKAHETDR